MLSSLFFPIQQILASVKELALLINTGKFSYRSFPSLNCLLPLRWGIPHKEQFQLLCKCSQSKFMDFYTSLFFFPCLLVAYKNLSRIDSARRIYQSFETQVTYEEGRELFFFVGLYFVWLVLEFWLTCLFFFSLNPHDLEELDRYYQYLSLWLTFSQCLLFWIVPY